MMKKLLFIACMGALVMASCTENKNANQLAGMTQNDSLNKIIEQKDNEINDMMGTLNEIQEGFRQISEAENRVSLMKDGEGANRAQQLRENIKFISGRMKENRELIEKLRQQMRESSMKGEQFKNAAKRMGINPSNLSEIFDGSKKEIENLFSKKDLERFGLLSKSFDKAACFAYRLPEYYDSMDDETKGNFKKVIDYVMSQ